MAIKIILLASQALLCGVWISFPSVNLMSWKHMQCKWKSCVCLCYCKVCQVICRKLFKCLLGWATGWFLNALNATVLYNMHIFFLFAKHRGWTAVTQHFTLSIRDFLFLLSGVSSGDSEWLPSQRPALSSSQFNKTAPFMLVGFSSGNGFPPWVSLFLQVSHFSPCTAGPHSRSDLLPPTLIS